MACLLKLRTGDSKGVVTFTTQEQRVINTSNELKSLLADLRLNYVTGLHFNWHDFNFKPDRKFDFFMAGEGDLKPVDDSPYHLFTMDACNFTPSVYLPTKSEKFWDVLIVGNPVFFKRPEVAIQTIRKLFDKTGSHYRVLYICPIPDYKKADERTAFYNIREYYEAMFTKEERTWFTLLTTTFNSPFPFDRNTLSAFFRNSRVFLHCAKDERRCRIAAYAWCAGLPVVAYPSVASILPIDLAKEPGYFRVENDENYVPQILSALKQSESFDADSYRKVFSETYTVNELEKKLKVLFDELQQPYDGKLLNKNLDIRLGWHHHGIGGKSNGLMQSLQDFMRILNQASENLCNELLLSDQEYPERALANEIDEDRRNAAEVILKNSNYLKPANFSYKLKNSIKSKLSKVFQ